MWKANYMVGIDLIDDQHKQLFIAIEKLKDSLKILDRTHYKTRLYETTTFLKDYCYTHFSDEQQYLRSIDYERYEEHKRKHDKILDDVTKYKNELLKTNFDQRIVENFLGFLTTWLIYHIGVEDQQIPKKELISPLIQKYEGIYHEYADSIRTVLSILTGLPEQDISHTVGNDKSIDSGICYQVRFLNTQGHSDIGFIYSELLAHGLVKEMTDMDAAEFNDVMYSALQEISEIIGAKIAGILSRETGAEIDIELPRRLQASDIHTTACGLAVYTKLGAMEVFYN